MTFTYDLTASPDIALIRLRINDRVEASAIFTDEELSAFHTAEGDTWNASAAALEMIALNQALLLKVVKILPMQTDGAKLAEAILKIAKAYRDRALAENNASGGLWDIAEISGTSWSARELIYNDVIRNDG